MKLLSALVGMALSFAMFSAAAQPASIQHEMALAKRITALAQAGNMGELDSIAEDMLSTRRRTRSGLWELAVFYRYLDKAFAAAAGNPTSVEKIQSQLDRLRTARPKSRQVEIMQALLLEKRAWQIRGYGYVRDANPQGWGDFKKHLASAKDVLDRHKDRLASNPAWFPLRIGIAMASSEGEPVIDRLFSEGAKREPTYFDIYFTYTFTKTPRWGGSEKQLAQTLHRFAATPLPKEGLSHVARTVWFLSFSDPDFVSGPVVDGKLVSASFLDLLQSYPDELNAQKLLALACERRDVSLVKRIAPYVKEAPAKDLHGPNTPHFEACLELGRKGTPFASRDSRTGKAFVLE